MVATKEEVQKLKEKFVKEHMMAYPYDEYITGVGISNLRVMYEKREIELKENESLDDLCLSVYFKKQPPEHLEFPEEYSGVRVFYQVSGEFFAQ